MNDRQRAAEHTGHDDLSDDEVRRVCDYLDGKSSWLVLRLSVTNNPESGIRLSEPSPSS